jgi:hypothetical protein
VRPQQPGRVPDVTGGQPVDDGLPQVALFLEPHRGTGVERGQPVRERLPGLEPEQVAEEVVVAVPGAGAVEADDELVGPGGVTEPGRAAGRVGEGVDEGAAELVDDRRLQQAPAIVVPDRGQQLVAQVVDDELVVAPEGVDELVGVGRPSEREAGEDQAGGPALRPAAEAVDLGAVERRAHRAEQAGRLVRREAQVGPPDLGDLVAHPEAAEPEGRVDAGRQHDRDLARAEVDEALDAPVHAAVLDQVVVVDDDDERLGDGGEGVHERGHHDELVAVRAGHDPLQVVRRDRVGLADGGDQVRPEAGRVGVALLHLEPGDGFGPAGQPGRHEGRLAGAGGGADQDQPDVAPDAGVEDAGQPRPAHEPAGR